MKYNEKYGDKTSTADKPCAVTAEALKALHRLPDGCDIWDCKEDTLRKEAKK